MGVLSVVGIVQPLSAQEADTREQSARPRLGGPDAVGNLLDSDRAEKDVLFETEFLRPYHEWQAGLRERYGIAFGIEYTGAYLSGSELLPDADSWGGSGMLRFFGRWDLVGRGSPNTGGLSIKLDNRHGYSDTPSSAFSLGSLGYVDAMYSTFSDEGWRLTNLHWRQAWNSGGVVLLTGLLSAPDFVDAFGLASPWLHFTSLAFSTGGGTISLPGDAALGAMVGGWLSEQVYVLGGLEDANSSATDPFDTFDTFFSQHEFFKHIEIGWTTSRDRAYVDNLHLTLWHADERAEADVESGWGGVLSFSRYISARWVPFIRAGYSDGGSSLMQTAVSAGFAFQPNPIGASAGHLLGFGATWGQPSETLYGSGLRDQYGLEAFYRVQLTRELAITPDMQLVMNPALNPDASSIWVFGLRGRVVL